MNNNKGFSLIELLGVVIVLGIISIIAVVAYSRYIESTRQNAYDTMAKSAADAASEYEMDHIGVTEVTFEELVEGDYLEYPYDPKDKGKQCTGKVEITEEEKENGLNVDKYDVTVCCATYNYVYHFPEGKKQIAICE